MSRRGRRWARALAAVVGCALLAGVTVTGTPWAAAQAQPGVPTRPIAWLNLGDSFAAGEGATRASGHCQQSPNAGGPKAATILREERGWTIQVEAFAACTGYLAADLFNSRDALIAAGHEVYGSRLKKEASDVPSTESLVGWARVQTSRDQQFDVITASLGGNDIGFADVVTGCIDVVNTLIKGANVIVPNVTGTPWEVFARAVAVERLANASDPDGCSVVGDELTTRVRRLLGGDPASAEPRGLVELYRTAANELLAPGGVFVVMGYPRLVTPSKTWEAWRHGQCNLLSAADADMLGGGAEEFDRRLRAAIEGIDDRFRYVSRLDVFDDGGNHHSLCNRGTTPEWLNTPLTFLRERNLRPERGFHPNDLGYLATAEAVAGQVAAWWQAEAAARAARDAAAVTTIAGPPPTVRSSEPHFEIGEPFSGRCTIAWPTAPYRSSSSITIRTTCGGVPKQFLFVDITYGDPDIDVTPSHPTVDVVGEITDISRNELGFTVLVVGASQMTVR